MRTTTSVFAAFLAVALATPVFADCGPAGRTSDTGRDEPSALVPENDRAVVPERLMGQVLALDREQGRLLLGTNAGTIALRGSPEQLANLEIGDTVEVEVEESAPPI
jgi:hypothetical protein